MSSAPTTTSRLSELRAWMARQGLDGLYVSRPVSIAYLTGVRAEPFERLMALVVQPEGATLVVPALERENAERADPDAGIESWRDGEDAYALVARAIAGRKRIGVEKDHLTVGAAERLRDLTGAGELHDIAAQLRSLRRRKTAVEIDALAEAGRITDSATAAILGRLRAGATELEMAIDIGRFIADAGASLAFDTLVQSGPNSALPHATPSSRQLAAGDLVLLDFGAACQGYRADTTRMAVVGEPDGRQREVHALVLAAHDAALDAVRPGVTTGEIDAAARRVIDDAGYGDRFFHRIGHGLGLEAHEEPSLDPGSSTVLEEGIVFTIEPGIYIPGWGGVRIEDDVEVERQGSRLLTNADRALHVIK